MSSTVRFFFATAGWAVVISTERPATGSMRPRAMIPEPTAPTPLGTGRRAAPTGDADLVRSFLTGDRAAFSTLVRRWEAPILRLAQRITGDHAEAEDVRQAVFLALLERGSTLREAERFAAWVHRLTVNAALNALKRRRRRLRAERRLLAARDHEPLDDSEPGERLAAADENARLALALSRLKPAERALLALRFDEDLTYEEIGAAVRLAPSSVRARLQKAADRLKRFLGESREERSH